MLKFINSRNSLIIKVELFSLALLLIAGFLTSASKVKPEPFTELYFDNHTNLPKVAEIDEVMNFSFTLHNLESKNLNYPYQVYLNFGNQKIMIDQGIISLKNGEIRHTKEAFRLTENEKTQVVVELTNKNQSIHYWIEKNI